MKKVTNIVEVLKESLIGKKIANIYVDAIDPCYGYLKAPTDGVYSRIVEGVIEDIEVIIIDYETGSIDIVVNIDSNQVRVNASYDDFTLVDLD
jgi:hypothetical protein